MKYENILNEIKSELSERVEERNSLEEKLQNLEIEIDKLMKAYESLADLAENKKKADKVNDLREKVKIKLKRTRGGWDDDLAFEDKIHRIFKEEDRPMVVSELMNIYNKKSSNENKKNRNSFSGMLSQTVKRTDKFRRISMPSIPGRSKHVYGLPSMFEGDELKDEYLVKLKNRSDLFER